MADSALALLADSEQTRAQLRTETQLTSGGSPTTGSRAPQAGSAVVHCPLPGSIPNLPAETRPLAAEAGEAPKRYGQASHRCKWLINVPDDHTLKIILTLCVEMLQK